MSYGVVYGIRNKLDDKFYVGRTKNLESRWKDHIYRKVSAGVLLHAAIVKHGVKSFELIELAHVDTEADGIAMEKVWVSLLNSVHPNGYNLTGGGAGGGISPCTETLQKYSAAQIGHSVSAETRKKMSDAKLGVPKSEEHRRKIGAASKGHPIWNKGKHLSAEHRQKIGAASKGRHHSAETRQKMSEARKQFFAKKDH